MADSENMRGEKAERPTALGRLLPKVNALLKNSRTRKWFQVCVLIVTLLPPLLMSTDYFHWWAAPWPPAVDRALVGLMTALLLASWMILAFFGGCHLKSRWRKKERPANAYGWLTLFYALFWPMTCLLGALWGFAYLTNKAPRLWGHLAVLYWILYQSANFCLMTARSFQEARLKRQSLVSEAASEPAKARRPAMPTTVKSVRTKLRELRFRLGRRWWHVTHPGYLRRLSPLNRALFESAVRGLSHNVEVFLKRGADPNLTLIYGMPLIAFCAGSGRTEMVRLLLDAGAQVDAARPSTGLTALLSASNNGSLPLTRLLIAHGANLEARTESGATPLMLAARNGHAEMIGLLLENGARIDTVSRSGVTALIFAAHRGHAEAVKVLRDAGADKTIKDRRGKTALDYARRKDHKETVALLEAA